MFFWMKKASHIEFGTRKTCIPGDVITPPHEKPTDFKLKFMDLNLHYKWVETWDASLWL